jgi:flagellar motor switch protein FliG
MSVMLSQAERAAVLVMLLDENHAAGILGRLGPDELKRLGETMIALGEIGPELISQSIGHFVQHTERQGIAAQGRTEKVETLLMQAVGAVKAGNLMQAIQPEGNGPALELARWLAPEALVSLVSDEHPQALAVLLVQLDPEVAAKVLHSLPPKTQTDVVHRVATLGPVPASALTMLEELLEARIAQSHGAAMLQMGGAREAADIINQAGKAAEKRIMPELARIDRQLAKTIENEMFKFEHLFVLDGQQMGTLLREIESDVLIDALKGIDEDQREVFFRAMSSRAADGVRDEISTRGRLKLAEVAEAQRAIVAIARRLAADGAIVFGAGGGEDEYV